MEIILAAVGRLKAEEAALFQRYWQRLRWKARLVELPEKGDKAQEAKALEKACTASPLWVCLDERGQDWDSPRFAAWLGSEFEAGHKPIAFMIGGAAGLAPDLRQRAQVKLRLGAMTWPHQIARVLLAEQLYRAQTILDGHPYHKV